MADDATPTDAAPADAGAAESDAGSEAPGEEPWLARVPDGVNSLGAGALATATLITFVGACFIVYSILNGELYGYRPYQMMLALMQFSVATLVLALGVHFARQRTRWTLVMLAAALGSLTFITIPFTATAFICVGLGKYHFASYTPAEVMRGE